MSFFQVRNNLPKNRNVAFFSLRFSAVIVCFFSASFAACGSNVSAETHELGKKEEVADKQKVVPLPARSKSDKILPVAFLEIDSSSGKIKCMGSYFGKGILLSAAHCVKDVSNADCASKVGIYWITPTENGATVSSIFKSFCASVVMLEKNSNGVRVDLAKIILADLGGVEPSTALELSTNTPDLKAPLSTIGMNDSGVLKRSLGFVQELRSPFLLSTLVNHGGFSGAPVFAEQEFETTRINAQRPVAAIHTAAVENVSQATLAHEIQKFLNLTQ